MKNKLLFFIMLTLISLCGCKSTYNLEPESASDLAAEGSVVVVRPDRYVLFGTRSAADYLRITYCNMTQNAGGLPEIKLGIKNVSGNHWWDMGSEDFTIYVQAVFYKEPLKGQSTRSAPIFKTNKQAVFIKRGKTQDLSFISPVKGAGGYQIIISED
ncbi:MAG: hypothetical protein KAS17_01085 [Victivallaceae bacterium]|nr:hypothetical protein [Victivallaceae bacterium]